MRVIGAAFNQKGLEHSSGVPILFYKTDEPDYVWEGKEDVIILPDDVRSIWAEVEIAFLILKTTEVEIEGYAVANDVTADYGADCHYLLGKSLPTFCKVSRPWNWVRPDYTAKMTMRINGVQHQMGCLNDMIIQPQALVSIIDKRVGLSTGDIVLSGTPYHEKIPLQKNDVVEVAVEGLGNIVSIVK